MTSIHGQHGVGITNVFELSQVDLRFFSDTEIRKLSVCQVHEPRTYDQLMNPVSGGLYDPKMGPISEDVICVTCREMRGYCPGHMGHISLPFPVCSPRRFSDLMFFLNSSCPFCERLRIDTATQFLFSQRMKLINAGLPHFASKLAESPCAFIDGLYDAFFQSSGDKKKDEESKLNSAKPLEFSAAEMRQIEEKVHKLIVNEAKRSGYSEKNLHEYFESIALAHIPLVFHARISLQNEVFKAASRYCPHCGDKNVYSFLDNRVGSRGRSLITPTSLIYIRYKGGNVKHNITLPANHSKLALQRFVQACLRFIQKRKDTTGSSFSNDLEQADCILIHPDELYEYARRVWTAEEAFLNSIFQLASGETFDFSVYFQSVVAVPANRFRPPEMRNNSVTESALHRMYRAILTTCADIRDEMTKSAGLITDRTVEFLTQLQTALTCVIDCNNDPDARLKSSNYGIKQIVEKKRGLFRGHMMGKRVNFCARTVILPDPMISTSEINIPLIFAQKLSFPETVNDYNIDKMRRLVKNGADLYPGADGVAVNGLKVSLAHMPYEERKALSKVLKKGVTVVHRHIQDGDLFLVNRQPSLHRNSMMAHSARIITNQRTLRIHYANCKSYNADFDGDEMNIHIPQDYISQSELKEVVMNETQYVSATSGEPLRGLIQDHVVAGVLLTLKNRVFDKEEYNTLVYGALFHRGHKHKIVTVPPAMLKPKMLWTGKQVISTILKDVAEGRPGINLDCACKLKNCWGGHNEENNVIIRDNEVLTGVFDKNQIGASLYGIVHAFDEIYGHLASAELLTCITRLCTLYLQYHGFSCGIDDLMVTDECNKERRIKLEKSDIEHRHATAKFAGLPREDSISDYDQHVAADNISRLLQVPKNIRRLDSEVKAVLQSTTSELTKKIVPDGLLKPFPRNCMTMMTQSGAKGSLVNASQISSALGLQEFEGSRVKPNIAGKTLPSFERHDMSAMAGGFVASRFLSGIKPQEYYFHCMAGRIGLIDTAVKTARSGYLQRCLIKNLEDLVVKYDGSIRNLSNCIVQFRYGGDGIDTNKVAFMHRHEIIAMNHKAYCNKYRINEFDIINHTDKRVLNYKGKDPMISSLDLSAWSCLGLVSETFQQSATQFIESSPLIKSKESKVKSSLELVADKFKRINNERFQRSLVEPGEAVGVLAGQSIGEPSTQMTLNTFHFAGLDMAHVTVGIPRLTELLMSGTTRAVVTTVPVRAKYANSPDEVKKFANSISSVLFSDVVKGVTSKEEFFPELGNMNRRVSITIQFDMEELTKYYHIKPASFWNVVKVHFVTAFDASIRRWLIGAKNRTGRWHHITRASVDARAVMTHLKSTTFEENESYDMLDGDDMESAPFKKQSKQAEDYDDEAQSDDEDETMQDEPEAKNNEPEEKQEPIQELLEATSKNSGVETRSSWLINRQQGTLTITLANTLPRVFIKDHVMAFCKATHIRHYQGIEKVNVIPKKSGGFDLQLEGFTLSALSTMPASYEFLDFNNLITSSVPLVAETFGIEAAYKHIVNEILMVFKMYGITVDERHISLIADYMCHTGVYSACNRHTMKRSPGPMHKASFESALTALNESVKHLESDPVNDPSSQLIFGKPVTLGTGCFDVLVPFSQE